jgi:putative transposase
MPKRGMPRTIRREVAGGVHHVYARGVHRQDVYLDDADREAYLALLGQEVERREWRCMAYCLMTNHVHLLVETPKPDLGAGVQRLHGDYARLFNQRHARDGHLFQGRFGSVLARNDAQLWAVAAYLAVNPVEAGLCGRPEAWRWSSHAAAMGTRPAPPWLDVARLLWHFGSAGGDPRGCYGAYVAERLRSPRAARSPSSAPA